jgi:hypothetical protein
MGHSSYLLTKKTKFGIANLKSSDRSTLNNFLGIFMTNIKHAANFGRLAIFLANYSKDCRAR